MHRHLPSDNPDLPQEKGKPLNKEDKRIMTTVRKVVLSLLNGEERIRLIERGRKIKHTLELPDIKKVQHTAHAKSKIKNAVHEALMVSGVVAKKRITKALDTLGGQYKDISPERFLHRLENGKVERDYRFLLGMMRHMAQLGEDGMKSTMKTLSGHGNHSTLKEKSPAMKSLSHLIKSTQKNFGKALGGKKGAKKYWKSMQEKYIDQ